MRNIEEFNIAVAEIFGLCYREFPTPVPIYKSDIEAAIKDGLGVDYDPSYINLSEREYKVVEHTLTWLIKAGYIWADNSNAPPTSMNIRLSPLGLEVLNSVPDCLQITESIGEKLSKGAKSLGKEALLATVNTALSIGLGNISA